jgi:hypothetical protein
MILFRTSFTQLNLSTIKEHVSTALLQRVVHLKLICLTFRINNQSLYTSTIGTDWTKYKIKEQIAIRTQNRAPQIIILLLLNHFFYTNIKSFWNPMNSFFQSPYVAMRPQEMHRHPRYSHLTSSLSRYNDTPTTISKVSFSQGQEHSSSSAEATTASLSQIGWSSLHETHRRTAAPTASSISKRNVFPSHSQHTASAK